MKKYLLVFLCALTLVVTGCGKNQVTCTATLEESGVKMDAKVVADFDKDSKLSDATFEYEFNDSSIVDQYCSIFKLMEDAAKGITVECSGKKITIKGYAKVASDEEESLVGVTKEEFIKQVEESEEGKFTCK